MGGFTGRGAYALPFLGDCDAMRKVDSLYIRDYEGVNRLLLLFAPSARGPSFEAQMQFFQEEDGELEQRGVLLGTIFVEGTSRIGDRQLSRAEVVGLREDFGVNPENFLIVLVDRDGTELCRDSGVVQPEVIYGYLDQPSSERITVPERDGVQHR